MDIAKAAGDGFKFIAEIPNELVRMSSVNDRIVMLEFAVHPPLFVRDGELVSLPEEYIHAYNYIRQ